MNKRHYSQGFTLIELMIVVAIIGILAAIAMPSYENYVRTSKIATAEANAVTLSTFVDAYFYESGAYLSGTYVPGADSAMSKALDWKPASDNDKFSYAVKAGVCPPINDPCYTITVVYIDDPSINATLTKP